eukprot:TRINITY_DN15173_c0_g1_i1.p1 TRINITY_DN15173_c0_g1~~TRINITY_DN15173_c0_g1_i1.p1  ORF type:complete len:170 (-),score=53.38 TRINITY_DN15173_c0_g1_i1:248-700(-)
MEQHPRIAQAFYVCEVSTSVVVLGDVFAVLNRRRSTVFHEEQPDGSALFKVYAHVPVVESFGMAEELRKRTSGEASLQLVLSHWAEVDEDPFFVPRTEEEREEFGDGSSLKAANNVARRLMDAVRRRKGLAVEEKVVESATKQRTRARKV